MAHNFYQLLGVEKKASREEIRLAYREMARLCHPDRFATQPPVYRELAGERMAEINEAYAVLTNAPRRKLYDECQRRGRDFHYVEMASVPESPGEREAREEDFAERRDLAVQLVQDRLFALDHTVKWREKPDEYFDMIHSGRHLRTQVTFHLKVLEQLDPGHLKGIVDYSRAVLETTPTRLMRAEFCFLLVGVRVVRRAALEKAVAEHNFSCWSMPTGLAPRSSIGWIDGKTGKLQVPEVEGAWPHLADLRLRLDQIL
jgi:hypothetical protein